MATSVSKDKYKLVYTVLPSHLQSTKEAIFSAGGGAFPDGKYVRVSFEVAGLNQFLPVAEAGANPHTGKTGTLEIVEEVRVEITCFGREVVRGCVKALKE